MASFLGKPSQQYYGILTFSASFLFLLRRIVFLSPLSLLNMQPIQHRPSATNAPWLFRHIIHATIYHNLKPHYTVNGVAIAFGKAIVDNFDRALDELYTKFEGGKAYLLKALDDAGYSYIPTEGCFICVTPKHKTAEEITEELKKRNILIFCGKGDSAGFLRITIWDKKYMKMFMRNNMR